MFVKCKNCKELMSFDRHYCGVVNISGGYDRSFLNEYGNCEYYEPTWWRFWLRKDSR